MDTWDALRATIDEPTVNSGLQTQYDKPGQNLLREYIDHAHKAHSSLVENQGITVNPAPGSHP